MLKRTIHWAGPSNELLIITPVSRWMLVPKMISLDHFTFVPASSWLIPKAEMARGEQEYLQLIPIKLTANEMYRTVETYGWMLDDPLSRKTRDQLDQKEFGEPEGIVEYDTPVVILPRVKEAI